MKKYLEYFKYSHFAVAALAFVAFLMIFFPAIHWGDGVANGLEVVFGYKETGEIFVATVTVTYFKFSFMNFLTYLLVLGAIGCAVYDILKRDERFFLLSTGLSFVSAILFLFTKSFAVLGDGLSKLYEFTDTTFAGDPSVTLGAGPIIAAVCLFLSAAIGVAKVVLDKTSK